MKRPPPVSHYPLHAAHASRYSSRSERHHAARRTPPHAANIHPPAACRPSSSAVRRLPPVARHPLPTTRLEGSSPRRGEQHGSSLSCDGTCSTPSTIAALPLAAATTPRALYRATPRAASRRTAPHSAAFSRATPYGHMQLRLA